MTDTVKSSSAPDAKPMENRSSTSEERRKEFWVERFRRARAGLDRPGETGAAPPQQPASGPGGKDYTHLRVIETLRGSGSTAYWVFEPAASSPDAAPVIVFIHGWGGTDPLFSGAWIDHLTMRGSVVLFPMYQTSVRSGMDAALENTVQAIRDAFRNLSATNHIRYDWNRLAVVGHSVGGLLAVQLAAVAQKASLPQPKAIMAVHPGSGDVRRSLPRVPLRSISRTTLMLIVVGQDDLSAGDREGRSIFFHTPQISVKNKNFITVASDYHGTPPLVANHAAPVVPRKSYARTVVREESSNRTRFDLIRLKQNRVDALHYYGYWKLFDGLMDAAFYRRNREYALGDTPQQRFMGTWSDGTPVAELKIGQPHR